MTDTEEFVAELLPSLEESYHEFLADPTTQPLQDGPIARVAFYTALLMVMQEDPLEDDMGLQDALEKRIVEMRTEHQLILDKFINNL